MTHPEQLMQKRRNRITTCITVLLGTFGTGGAVVSFTSPASERADQNGKQSFVTQIPDGYRDWKLISVAHEEGQLNDIRAILGNDIAVEAYRTGKLPFPDGAMIARLAWSYVASEENNKTFGRSQTVVAGPPTNGVQFMVKDGKKYASTGGWGFGHFEGGKPAQEAVLNACYDCHQAGKSRDLVLTKYSP